MIVLHTPEDAAEWLRSHVTGTLRADSRNVEEGDGFIAWPGAATDGRRYVQAALHQGASACLVEQAGVNQYGFSDDAIASYPSLRDACGPLASAYYGNPSQRLDLVAVTGTNGKTSTAWWLALALMKTEQIVTVSCGLIGTLGAGFPPNVTATGLTTPDPVLLQRHFRQFVDAGATACVIEASSIGLAERRLDGTCVKVAVFTNFTQDHLDYHGSMAVYWQAKRELFDWSGLQGAVINLDDPKGQLLAQALAGGQAELWTYSCQGAARIQAGDIGYGVHGLDFAVIEGTERHWLSTHLIGQYNVANILAVVGAMRALGVPLATAVQACRALLPVPGRMECLAQQGNPLVVVDYAHTPDALEKALTALRPLAQGRRGRLWCVFGCGGDRDSLKRPLMGMVAGDHADEIVITSDNPRSESADAIIGQIMAGLPGKASVHVEPDRAAAIIHALTMASPRDVVLLAGKGHERYQEIAGARRPFSDLAEAAAALRLRGAPMGLCEGART